MPLIVELTKLILMKKYLIVILLLLPTIALFSQEERVKTGWKFGGALPAITFDTDLGFQYGALVEFFNYGDGNKYPDYFDHIYIEGSRFTKGSGIYRLMFESDHIIPNVDWSSDLSFLPDKAAHFYGFNGYESVFNIDWMDEESIDYKTRMFYRYQRNQFRFKNDFQGTLAGNYLKWNAGFAFQNFAVSSVDLEKLNKGKDLEDMLPDVDGLFDIYKDMEIIPVNEADGGWVNSVKLGVSWDSRDNKPNPMKGIWTELGIEMAPGFLGNESGFSKFYLTHRQYFTLIEDDLSLVYRIGYQATLTGHTPFYYQSQVITSRLTGATSEGLGGAATLRGILKNRVIGDDFAYANVELRWKPIYFTLFNQDFYIGVDLFYDLGVVTKAIELPSDLSSRFTDLGLSDTFSSYFKPGKDTFHQSAGVSLMIAMNQNFVIAVDLGKAFDDQDGNIGFSMGLNYLF